MDAKASTVSHPSAAPQGVTRLRRPASMTAMLEMVDWESLPPAQRKTISTLGSLLAEGYSRSEISKRTGMTEAQVTTAIADLAEVLLQASGELELQLRARVESLRRRSSTA